MKLKEKIYIQELREQFLQKIVDDWAAKWQGDLGEFVSFEAIKNKNAFLESLLFDIETTLSQKLNSQSSKYLFSKDFLRRFVYEYGHKEARIQSHSRMAIAFYLGYDSWDDFLQKNQDLQQQHININYVNLSESSLPMLVQNKVIRLEDYDFSTYQEVKQKRHFGKYIKGFLIVLAIGGLGYFAFYRWINRSFDVEDLSKIKFEVVKTLGKYPQAVRVRYDVSALPNVQSIEIQMGVGDIISAGKSELLLLQVNKKVGTVGHTYFYPGAYHLVLIVNKKPVKDLTHVVYSKPNVWTAWAYGVAYGKDWTTDISSTKSYIKDGVFHFDPAELPQEIKQDDDLRNVLHDLTQDYYVALDSMQIEARIKNPENEGGEGCYDMEFMLWDKNFNFTSAKFTTEGCTDYAQFRVGNTFFRYSNNPNQENVDLDNFGVNPIEWNVFKIKIMGKIARVYVNDKLAFTGQYETTKPIAKIVDLRFVFKGAGSIDWVKMSNSFTGKVVYETDFESPKQ